MVNVGINFPAGGGRKKYAAIINPEIKIKSDNMEKTKRRNYRKYIIPGGKCS
jgi:hypothetical protein